jgi:hypothetical protein
MCVNSLFSGIVYGNQLDNILPGVEGASLHVVAPLSLSDKALSTLSADLGMVAGGLPELALRDRAASLAAGAIQHHLESCFSALSARILGAVSTLTTLLSGANGALGGGVGGGMRGAGDTQGAGAQGGSPALLRKAYTYMVELVGRGLEALMQVREEEATCWRRASCTALLLSGVEAM